MDGHFLKTVDFKKEANVKIFAIQDLNCAKMRPSPRNAFVAATMAANGFAMRKPSVLEMERM